ncbi:MAG: hypothetical protein KDI61_03325 [Alphaproteobacteria bacterium]|nr:hypothetical protein [Alphaproteobacteria bacterium]
MSRIGDSGSGPTWPSTLPEDQTTGGEGKSEFDKALERQQRGLPVNPLASAPPAELKEGETDDNNPDKRVQPVSESVAGDNQDHGKDDPNADLDWRIREQLGL